MARTTISLPDDLKKEMEQYKEANWSSLAASAFRAEIDRLKAKQQLLEGKSMNAAIERLKKSRKTFAMGANIRGHDAGTQWALTKAAYADLKAIHDRWEHLELYDGENPAQSFFGMIAGKGDFRIHMNTFLEIIGMAKDDVDGSSPNFWLGFGEGALEVFEKIPSGK
jgi:hypothetical protein